MFIYNKIHNIDIALIYLVVSYLDKFFEPIGNMLYHYEDLQKGKISMKRIDDLLGNESNIENIYQGEKAEKLDGNIKFINVNFSNVKGVKILENVNFSINAGEKIALIGKTGSDKTTIINLILGFYKIDSGNIMVNNDNNISDKEIVDILKTTGLYDKVSTLKNGIYEKINNKSLSKGEIQLLAFARAIAKETSIYIFDEPTSNIDGDNEKKIRKIIDKLSKKCTIIIIAHKTDTIKNVDRIFEISNNRINVKLKKQIRK